MREKYGTAEEMLQEKVECCEKKVKICLFLFAQSMTATNPQKHKQMCPKYKSQINTLSFSRICFISLSVRHV